MRCVPSGSASRLTAGLEARSSALWSAAGRHLPSCLPYVRSQRRRVRFRVYPTARGQKVEHQVHRCQRAGVHSAHRRHGNINDKKGIQGISRYTGFKSMLHMDPSRPINKQGVVMSRRTQASGKCHWRRGLGPWAIATQVLESMIKEAAASGRATYQDFAKFVRDAAGLDI